MISTVIFMNSKSEVGECCIGRSDMPSHQYVQHAFVLGTLCLSASLSAHQAKKRSFAFGWSQLETMARLAREGIASKSDRLLRHNRDL